MDIQLRIKELLTEKKISITEFSEKLNVSRNTVYNFLNKKYPIDVDLLQSIASILDIPITAFFTDKDSPDLNKEVAILKSGINKLSNRNDQQRALLAMIRSRLKTSIYLYKMFEANMPKSDPNSIEFKSRVELQEIFIDTYNEILAAINLSNDFTLNMIEMESVSDEEIKDYWRKTLGIETDDKLESIFEKFLTRLKENESLNNK